jgi:hypothetical protein
MRKLMLDVGTLRVESFPTSEADAEARGTVNGHAATLARCTGQASCFTSCRADLRDGCTCPPP